MTYEKLKIGLISLVAFGAIAVYSSVMQALLTGFIIALVIPPVAAIGSIIYLGRKNYLHNESRQ